jgi:hypothetical protein
MLRIPERGLSSPRAVLASDGTDPSQTRPVRAQPRFPRPLPEIPERGLSSQRGISAAVCRSGVLTH